jgi:superfamily I DNA and/or RNA helicase
MRQPETIQAEILTADSKIGQASAAITPLDARIADILSEGAELERSLNTGRAALVGVNRQQLANELSDADEKKAPLNREIASINAQLADLRKLIIDSARIVGATVTRLYLSPKTFTNFDVVIIDEASMVLLPALFHAGLAKEKVIISGDFRQLAPIVPTDEKAILAELGEDVFGRAGITKTVNSGVRPKRTVMLEQQSRMHEQICQMISRQMYEGRLQAIEYKPAEAIPPTRSSRRSRSWTRLPFFPSSTETRSGLGII